MRLPYSRIAYIPLSLTLQEAPSRKTPIVMPIDQLSIEIRTHSSRLNSIAEGKLESEKGDEYGLRKWGS